MKDSALASSSRLGGAVISDRVVASLLEELRTGRYARCDRLPAEVDLAAELGVSRTVIRDALSEMERAGYVERVRGIGTVVNRSVLNLRSRLDQKLEYYPLIRSFGSFFTENWPFLLAGGGLIAAAVCGGLLIHNRRTAKRQEEDEELEEDSEEQEEQNA